MAELKPVDEEVIEANKPQDEKEQKVVDRVDPIGSRF